MKGKVYFVDETEWGDRVAMAVEMLLKRPGIQRRSLRVGNQRVEWTGNVFPPEGFGGPEKNSFPPEALPFAPPSVTAYVFDRIQDPEILRRLNQMPDETPLDLLALPFSIYCSENHSFVCLNDPSTAWPEHLQKMEGPIP